MTDIDELRRLRAAGTKGEWTLCEGMLKNQAGLYVGPNRVMVAAKGRDYSIASTGPVSRSDSYADAALICAAVNSLPSLLDELARTRAALAAVRERLGMATAALEACRPTIAEMAAPQMTYGAGGGCDPRDFDPDPDASTEAERAQHAIDCERAAKGEPVTTLTTCVVDGPALVSYQGWGLGTYTYTDEAAVNALASLDAALAAARKETL